MEVNKQYSKCAKCKKGIGEIPIADKNNNQYWICEDCDMWLFEVKDE